MLLVSAANYNIRENVAKLGYQSGQVNNLTLAHRGPRLAKYLCHGLREVHHILNGVHADIMAEAAPHLQHGPR